VATNNRLKPGREISKFNHLITEGTPKISLLITGTNESDMLKTYQTVNKQLQECIEYY
jgi:hypothetical protein